MPANQGNNRIERATRQQPPSPSSDERITVALIPKATADLQSLRERSGLSKTDLVNRAISLYEFIDAQIHEGKDVLIRDPAEGEILSVHLL